MLPHFPADTSAEGGELDVRQEAETEQGADKPESAPSDAGPAPETQPDHTRPERTPLEGLLSLSGSNSLTGGLTGDTESRPALGLSRNPLDAQSQLLPPLPSMNALQVMQLLELPQHPPRHLGRPSRPSTATQEEGGAPAWLHKPAKLRGRHDAPLQQGDPADFEEAQDPDAPLPQPRPYLLGNSDERLAYASLLALSDLQTTAPDIGSSAHQRLSLELGHGEGEFLNGRSALWSWRLQRQSGLSVHTLGPLTVGRNLLLEQKVGLVTVLQGCRVLTLTEQDRSWGYTLGSLEGQVYRLWEKVLVEWEPDDRVTLHATSHHEVALRGFGLVPTLLLAARRSVIEGYGRAMTEFPEFE